MPVKLFIEYDLKIASFYDGEDLLYKGITKTGFFKVEWILSNNLTSVIASIKFKKKIFELNSRIIFTFEKPECEELVIHSSVKKGPHLRFIYKGHVYLIVFHKGNKYSFYRDDVQFGFLIKKSVSIGNTTEYNVVADQGTSIELLVFISYSILIDTEDIYDDSSEFTIDYGFLGPEYKEFNSNWLPK